jgi:hypothetical protein
VVNVQRVDDALSLEGGASMIKYRDMRFLIPRQLGPEVEPGDYPDIAPFPVWLVPPVWRCARQRDILEAIGSFRAEHKEEGEEEVLVTTQALARWFERLDVEWDHATALEEWHVREPAEVLVVWKHGKKASQRSPFVEDLSPFPLLSAWFKGTIRGRWLAEREGWQAVDRTPAEVDERAAVVLCVGLADEYERLEELVRKVAQVYGVAAPGGTDACLDFYAALQHELDQGTLPPYRQVLQDLSGSLELMEAEIAYRAQLEEVGRE